MRPLYLSAQWRGQTITLRKSQFALVYYLADHPGAIRSRDTILDALHGYGEGSSSDRSIDTIIKLARQAFRRSDPSFDALETVYGLGYRWAKTTASCI